jgi:hypothetical protein|tara:strand:+ start:1404 stop:1595 length:192 start_codon:yes stop_codon:yes gene_type:complete
MVAPTLLGMTLGPPELTFTRRERTTLERALAILMAARTLVEYESAEDDRLGIAEATLADVLED